MPDIVDHFGKHGANCPWSRLAVHRALTSGVCLVTVASKSSEEASLTVWAPIFQLRTFSKHSATAKFKLIRDASVSSQKHTFFRFLFFLSFLLSSFCLSVYPSVGFCLFHNYKYMYVVAQILTSFLSRVLFFNSSTLHQNYSFNSYECLISLFLFSRQSVLFLIGSTMMITWYTCLTSQLGKS